MFVADLTHYLDMPDTVPAPARRVAEQLMLIVRAATAGPGGIRWVTAIGCPKRPARQKCVGLISVYRSDVPASIDWFCTTCGDDGTISGWERTPYDLRPRPGHTSADQDGDGEVLRVIVPADVAATLQTLTFLDETVERMVFQAASTPHGIMLVGTFDDIDELLDAVAAEANHEPDRRRQKRLDNASDVLTETLG
jgi:hypothetical protein